MSDLLREEIKRNLGRFSLIFLKNNFRFKVKLLDCDEIFIKVLDVKTTSVRFYKIDELQSLEVLEDES